MFKEVPPSKISLEILKLEPENYFNERPKAEINYRDEYYKGGGTFHIRVLNSIFQLEQARLRLPKFPGLFI